MRCARLSGAPPTLGFAAAGERGQHGNKAIAKKISFGSILQTLYLGKESNPLGPTLRILISCSEEMAPHHNLERHPQQAQHRFENIQPQGRVIDAAALVNRDMESSAAGGCERWGSEAGSCICVGRALTRAEVSGRASRSDASYSALLHYCCRGWPQATLLAHRAVSARSALPVEIRRHSTIQ